MAWLFRKQPSHLKTPGFPALGESSTPAFPLAAGNFPETDIISTNICCDPYSTFCVSTGSSPASQTIIGALPIVSYTENGKSYKQVLYKVLGGRFVTEYVTQIFLSILLNIPDAESENIDPATRTYYNAIRWACKDLIKNSTTLLELSITFSEAPQLSQPWLLDTVLRNSFEKINETVSSVIRYPLDGFIVVVRAASIAHVDPASMRRVVFRRYLYLLVDLLHRKQLDRNAIASLLYTNPTNKTPVQTVTPDPTATANSMAPEPVFSLPIAQLRGSAILDERTYRTLAKMEEFRFLEQRAADWVGPATGAFLHAMVAVDGTGTGTVSEPWD
ncbi:hypothetical protein K469DRAFT_756735 [Zopfia rhizophila CBS 207.26]|uniref:Uncharacterized protein n=1 Tax=Zopfia rhizophila CBS 207.26 TaxID=1314779 RepID=A0A6A6D8B7_9PEZI|nr:hypothetical protein K469DRAFT_756735 [Zopfia rhizophila CBS 207.26]